MKPDNWGQMNAADKREMAMRLLHSQRGKLIVGKALAKAISVMQYAAYPEHSDMEDMEILGETLFHLGYVIDLVDMVRRPRPPVTDEQMRCLYPYIATDDDALDKGTYLRNVADRIISDLAEETRNEGPDQRKATNDPEHNG